MSIEAMTWAMNQPTTTDTTVTYVLVGFANHAAKDGTKAFPSLETIAAYCRCSRRTVQRAVQTLLEHGLMREGDQQLVAHYKADRRPIVYDLAMDEATSKLWADEYRNGAGAQTRAQAQANGARARAQRRDNLTPRPDGADPVSQRRDNLTPRPTSADAIPADTPKPERGDTGVTPRRDTGDASDVTPVSHKPSFEPSTEPSIDPPSLRSGPPVDGEPVQPSLIDSLVDASRFAVDHLEPDVAAEPAAPVGDAVPVPVEGGASVHPIGRRKRRHPLPPDWALTAELRASKAGQAAAAAGVDLDAETESFRLHAGKTGTVMADWDLAWQAWMRKAPSMPGTCWLPGRGAAGGRGGGRGPAFSNEALRADPTGGFTEAAGWREAPDTGQAAPQWGPWRGKAGR